MMILIRYLMTFGHGPLVMGRQRGATLVEYALIIGLISIAAITAMVAIGADIGSLFSSASDAVDPSQGGDQTGS